MTVFWKTFSKLLLLVVCLLLSAQPLQCTFSDFEGGLIAIQQDTLSWPQIGLLKLMFLILFKMWVHGVLPVQVELPLHHMSRDSGEHALLTMDHRLLHNNNEANAVFTPEMKYHRYSFAIVNMLTIFCKIIFGYFYNHLP